MNANRVARTSGIVLALVLGVFRQTRAEVGAVHHVGSQAPAILYVMEGGEDPTPITPMWKQYQLTPDRMVLNPQGESNGDGSPALLTNPASGMLAVAWARASAGGYDVVVSRFTGGAWTAPQVVVGAADDELDPQLVLDPNGSVHLLYWVEGATRHVFEVTAPADLSSWSAPVLVSQAGESACRPAGVFYNGVLHVAYEVHNFGNGSSPREVVLSRLDNGVFTPEVVAMTNNLGDVYPQVHSHSGRLWVDWIDTEVTEGSGEIAWTRLDAQGQWEPIRYDAFSSRFDREYKVRSGVRLEVAQ